MRKTLSHRANFLEVAFLSLSFLPAHSLYSQNPVTPPSAYSSNLNKSYVRTWEAIAPIQDPNALNTALFKEVKVTTQYFDGLGRPLQTVIKKGSLVTDPNNPVSGANAVDMVGPIVYDEFGREQYKYLPFAANTTGGYSTNDGLFKLNPFQQQSTFANAQYPLDAFFYGKTNFEASSLNRINEAYAPGDSWVGSEANSDPATRRNVMTQYLFNESNDSVRIWTVSGGSFATSAVYAANQLYETVTIDEHKNKIVEYTDKEGKLMLKKVQISSSPSEHHAGWFCTYYIYDDYNLLRGVLQPKAVEELLSNGWTITTDILNDLTFRYEYDEKKRMIVKNVPGAGGVWMIYDKWDRVVLTQDANLRDDNKWLFTKYDRLNRPIMTGFYINSTYTTQSGMQGYLDAQGLARYENYQTATFPLYSLDQAFPVISYSDVLTITYYDDYSWTGWYGFGVTKDGTWDGEFATTSNTTWPYPQSLLQGTQTKGLITGVWDKTGSGLLTATYYDDKGRIVQTRTYNHTTGFDYLTTQYSFSGQLLQTVLRHQKSGTNAQIHLVQTRMNYDEAGRLLKIEKKLNSTIGSVNLSEGWHTTASFEHDALGQVKKKTIAPDYSATGLDTLSNTYNIRGWLTAINKGYIEGTSQAWFGMELDYDKNGYGTFSNKQYNGNISGTIWRTRGDGERRKYEFAYDAANRLLKADFTQKNGGNWDVAAGIDFSMKMGDDTDPLTAYDANGNIKKMWQRGWKPGGSVTIDSLIYQSNTSSNKLKYVRDGNNDPNTTLADFKESAQNNSDNVNSNTADYAYDDNGNMVSDANKSISSITYNHLNLPTSITVTGKGAIDYVYDNSGNKLKKIVTEGSSVKTTLYVAGFVYENDTLQLLQHEEGRVRITTDTSGTYNGYAFDYFEKDHLGNVRVVLTEQRDTASYPPASMETVLLGDDTLYYSKIPETRIQRSNVPGYPATDTYTNPNDWVAKTSSSGSKIGPAILLKVMVGDQFNLRVSSWYRTNGASPGAPVDPLSDVITALISGIGGVGKFGVSELQSSSVLGPNVTEFFNDRTYTTGRPKAYVNWIFFNEQLIYDSASSGFEQVPVESTFWNGTDSVVYVHQRNGLTIGKSGYLFIYVSNETQDIDVFFDNLQVTHLRGPLIEETHYYPFGLTMAGISSKAMAFGGNENKYKFQGQEFASKEFSYGSGLEMYEFKYRMHDAQIGRFWQVDPLSEKYVHNSTYAFSENKVTTHIELEGLEGIWFMLGNNSTIARGPVIENVVKPTVEAGTKVAEIGNKTGGKTNEHHILPRQFKGDPVVQKARDAGFKFEGNENKIPLEQYSKATGQGRHANHRDYNTEVGKRLADFKDKNPNATPKEALDFVRTLVKELRDAINNNPDTKVNDLYSPKSLMEAPIKDGVTNGLPDWLRTQTPPPAVEKKEKSEHICNCKTACKYS